MNRNLLVTLLRKNIEELEMITEGFMEMTEYPNAIIMLAKRKTDEIQSYIQQLAEIKSQDLETISLVESETIIHENADVEEKLENSDVIDMEVSDVVLEEIDSMLKISTIYNSTPEEVVQIEVSEDNEQNSDVDNEFAVENHEEVTGLEPEIINPESKKTFLNNKETTISRNELLATEDNSISNTLANKKISDIKQAISIGERFRFQRELFRGNGEDMNKTLTYINQLATLDEVMAFLQSKYNWAEDNETAAVFFQIVKRRF